MLAHDKIATGRQIRAKLSRVPELVLCRDPAAWDGFVAGASDGSLLQSWSWGELKARYGWEVARYLWLGGGQPSAAIGVLRRKLAGGLALHYAPRGPVLDGHLDEWPALWPALRDRLASAGGTVLKVDPEWTRPEERAALDATGGLPSRHPIQHQATMMVDITGGDRAMSRFKESTRRNIRLGERQGIIVEASQASAAMDAFHGLLVETASRRRFTARPRQYHQDLLSLFRERGQVEVYLARLDGHLLAGAVMLYFGCTLIYLFGATAADTSRLQPAYLLHWRAVQNAQRRGCTRYDLWGVPLDPAPTHPGYGYYVFKSRFNGELVRYIGLYDLPVKRAAAFTVRLAERFARAGQPEFV